MERYNDVYNKKCLTCANYEVTTNWHAIHSDIGFACSKHGWQSPDDSCGSYSNAHRSDRIIDSCYKEFIKKQKYYIVSTCSYILGLEDNNEYILAFEDMVSNHITTDYEKQLLIDYDNYGVTVSCKLLTNYLNLQTSEETLNLINNYIIPKFNEILKTYKEGRYSLAVKQYLILTRRLMKIFEIKYPKNEFIYNKPKILKRTLFGKQK